MRQNLLAVFHLDNSRDSPGAHPRHTENPLGLIGIAEYQLFVQCVDGNRCVVDGEVGQTGQEINSTIVSDLSSKFGHLDADI